MGRPRPRTTHLRGVRGNLASCPSADRIPAQLTAAALSCGEWYSPYDDRAGADPWRPVLAGSSPGRLSLAGPTPDLFPLPEGEGQLSEAESAAARDGRRRIAALAGVGWYDGTKLACVAGIDAPEAVLRFAAVPPDAGLLAELLDDPSVHDRHHQSCPHPGEATLKTLIGPPAEPVFFSFIHRQSQVFPSE